MRYVKAEDERNTDYIHRQIIRVMLRLLPMPIIQRCVGSMQGR
jgi:hypothetical protein